MRKGKRKFILQLLMCFVVTACGGHGCDDPPSGTDIPDGVIIEDLESCASLGPTAEEFTGGSMYQCKGSGSPIMFTQITCTESLLCPEDNVFEKDKEVSEFSYGNEAYESLSIGSCCNETALTEDINSSCEYSCGTLMCDKMLPYLKWLRSSNDEMTKFCCQYQEDGTYDCKSFDVLLTICEEMLDDYIDRVQETSGWPGGFGWVDYCKTLVVEGIDDPNEDEYDYDADCEGIYLGDLDFNVLGATISVRNTCVYPRCHPETPPNNPLPSEPASCASSSWGEMPEGWPEGAWEAQMEAEAQSGDVTVEFTGGLGSLLSDHGFSGDRTESVTDGNVLYGIECDSNNDCIFGLSCIRCGWS